MLHGSNGFKKQKANPSSGESVDCIFRLFSPCSMVGMYISKICGHVSSNDQYVHKVRMQKAVQCSFDVNNQSDVPVGCYLLDVQIAAFILFVIYMSDKLSYFLVYIWAISVVSHASNSSPLNGFPRLLPREVLSKPCWVNFSFTRFYFLGFCC